MSTQSGNSIRPGPPHNQQGSQLCRQLHHRDHTWAWMSAFLYIQPDKQLCRPWLAEDHTLVLILVHLYSQSDRQLYCLWSRPSRMSECTPATTRS